MFSFSYKLLTKISPSDFIDQLMENGKDVEAVYFASEAGLTGRFRPASLLQSCIQKNTEILKNANDFADASVSQPEK